MSTLRNPDTTQSKADDVRKLHEAGLSVREIARALDLSTQGVHYHLKRLDLPTKKDVAS